MLRAFSAHLHLLPPPFRPIKFPCSDCSSPTLEQALLLKCANVGSRSNSPADSETSGVSSIDGNFSDLMVCVSVLSDCWYRCAVT
jgi:hypothetical protein